MRLLLILLFILASCTTPEKTPYEKDLDNYLNQQSLTKRSDEVRALWIVRLEMKSKSDIDKSIAKMLEYSLNTAIVQVRGLSDVLYPSKIEPMADEIEEGLEDPFQYFIDQAKVKGIKVQAWVNVNMLSKPKFLEEFSKAEKHLVKQRPDWVLVDEEGRSMLDYEQEELEADWMDGAYANPLNPKWKEYFLNLVSEIQKKYEIDGIHLDFIRYPNAKHAKRVFGLDDLHLKEVQKIIPLSK
ncbi:MAG: family 10 glycosylhydrolase, partial [Bdellovibrionota bacterium]|nr:family 10 glycosylhydrolase [Bdellovibrionota bacterium]